MFSRYNVHERECPSFIPMKIRNIELPFGYSNFNVKVEKVREESREFPSEQLQTQVYSNIPRCDQVSGIKQYDQD